MSRSVAFVAAFCPLLQGDVPQVGGAGPQYWSCPCAQVACGYVMRSLGVSFDDEDLAVLVHERGRRSSFAEFETLLRMKGLDVEIRQVSPRELAQGSGLAILETGGSPTDRHFETLLSIDQDTAYFAGALTSTSGRVIARPLDYLAGAWDGRALIVTARSSGAVAGSMGARGLLVSVAVLVGAVAVGWIVTRGVRKARAR